MEKSKKARLIGGILLLSLVLVMVITGSIIDSDKKEATFPDDVYINGANVSGYTISEATGLVKQNLQDQIKDINIEIIYKDKVWTFTEDDFDVDQSVKNVVQSAFKIKNLNNSNAIKFIASQTGYFKTAFNEVFKNFDTNIEKIVTEIEQEPVDSTVKFTPDDDQIFTITDAKNGVKVDTEKLYDDLEKQFMNTKDIKVYVSTSAVEPKITSSYFEDKLNLMGKFSTDLTNSQAGRLANVKLALSKFNGKVIEPDEVVSYNDITGPQNESGGYQPAIVIVNGIYQQGIGGGLCQGSTTLYNACLLSNLDILEVHKHSLPVGYVELALDAMVADGYADFQFKNNSDYPIYIKSYVANDRAYAEIYGKTMPDDTTIKRKAELVATIPHRGDKIVPDTNGDYASRVTYKGEYYRLKYPKEGYEAKGYLEYYKNGELVKREEVRHEKYQPVDGIVIEGVKDLPTGYVLPKSDVTIIPPQTMASENVSVVVRNIQANNPTQYAM